MRFLREQSNPEVPPALDLAHVGLVDPGDDPEQRGLARPVRADHADPLAGRDRGVDPVEDHEGPDLAHDSRETDQRHGQAAPVPARARARRVAAARRVRSARARAAALVASAGVSPSAPSAASSVHRPPHAPGEAGAREDGLDPDAIRRRQPLAPRAVVGGPLADDDALDRAAAAGARLARPLVDGQVLLHRAVALGCGVVVDGRAAPIDRLGQDSADRPVEPGLTGRSERRDPAERMQARAPERLVRVDVADPRRRMPGRAGVASGGPRRPCTRARKAVSVNASSSGSGPCRANSSPPAAPPSTAPVRGSRAQSPTRPNLRMSRKRISRPSSSCQGQVEMPVGRGSGRHDEQLPGHLEVDRERRITRQLHDHELRPAADALDAPASEALRERGDGLVWEAIRRGQSPTAPLIVAPTTSRRRSRATVSTSGSSGIARRSGSRARAGRPSSTPSRRRSSRPR